LSNARKVLRYWLPALLYSAAVLLASGDVLSAQHTGPLLYRILSFFFGPISRERFEIIHHLARKCGHVAAYAVMSYAWFRAARHRSLREHLWHWHWAVFGLCASIVVAALDEYRQSFYRSRTSSPWDVLLDSSAALLAQLVVYAFYRWWTRRHSPAIAAA